MPNIKFPTRLAGFTSANPSLNRRTSFRFPEVDYDPLGVFVKGNKFVNIPGIRQPDMRMQFRLNIIDMANLADPVRMLDSVFVDMLDMLPQNPFP